jgi:GWxTD domain-containing protein
MRKMLILFLILTGTAYSQEFPPLPGELDATYQYLFSLQQQRQFSVLKDDEDRIQYWNNYWKALDPTPGSAKNELLRLFRRRYNDLLLFQNNAGFTQGWRGDRGHVYMIYGPPKEIHKSYAGAVLQGEIHKEVWVYEVVIDGTVNRQELIFEEAEDENRMILKTPVQFARDIALLPRLPDVNLQLEFQ